MKTVLLIGCPNSGKTAIFNLLTGQNKKVANYSGITVDLAAGELLSNEKSSTKVTIIDLPGIYGLHPTSIDEAVTVGSLMGLNPKIKSFDEIVMVIDPARLDSSLSLTQALVDVFGIRVKVIVNKSDLTLGKVEWKTFEEKTKLKTLQISAINDEFDKVDTFIRQGIDENGIEALKQIELTQKSFDLIPFDKEGFDCEILDEESVALKDLETYQRQARELRANISEGKEGTLVKLTQNLDRFALHPFWGGVIFFLSFYLIFHSIYTWSGPLMDLIDGGVGSFGDWVGGIIPPGEFNSFVVDGIIAGVGGVIIFLPQIVILFILLSFLEQSGYISRAAIITDRMMAFFGLNGKAFLPYMSGFACAIPAIMATRTISDKRERLATLMTIPLTTCSARLPVYVLLIGTFIPEKTVLGVFNSQALAFFFLYFLGSIVALVMAKIFRLTLYKGSSSSFYMELPLYQRPKWRFAWRSAFLKGKVFLKKAGGIILVLSMAIWVLSTYPKVDEKELAGLNDAEVAARSLEHSVLGRIGKTIEPVIRPIGYDWKMGVGILIAFGARELFVSAMGTIYALGDVDEESSTLRQRLLNERDPATGAKIYSPAVAWSLLVFFAFACQCISTLAIVRRETDSVWYPVGMFAYMGALAYVGAFIAYRLAL